jgi:carbonic anhydrase
MWEPGVRFNSFSGYPFAVEWQQQGCHSEKGHKVQINIKHFVNIQQHTSFSVKFEEESLILINNSKTLDISKVL